MAEIYLITNIINNMKYVGYTTLGSEARFNKHYAGRHSDGSFLHKAMSKYGKDSFYVEKIEDVELGDPNNREDYWINRLDTLAPIGYNLVRGGGVPPVFYGDSNSKTKIPDSDIVDLLADLAAYELDFGEISRKYGVSQSQIERINAGTFRRVEGVDYPIRKVKRDVYIIGQIIKDLKENLLSQSEIEEKYKIVSRTRLYDINTGRVGKNTHPQDSYPLRPGIVNRKPIYLQK